MNKQKLSIKYLIVTLTFGSIFIFCGCGGGTYGTGADTTRVKEIRGTIKDDKGAPVSKIEVTLQEENISSVTESNGEFSLALDREIPSSVTISLAAPSLNTEVKTRLPSKENVYLEIIVNVRDNVVLDVVTDEDETVDSERNNQNHTENESGYCAAVYEPVCGVDGSTYGNTCEAGINNIEVAYKGECTSASDLISSGNCAQDYNPVCGADGRTYTNACSAKVENVPVVSDGECPSSFKGCSDSRSGPVCGSNGITYDSQCAAFIAGAEVSYHGTCENNEALYFCAALYDPVCGVDGRTYPNECEAGGSKVAVAHKGACD